MSTAGALAKNKNNSTCIEGIVIACLQCSLAHTSLSVCKFVFHITNNGNGDRFKCMNDHLKHDTFNFYTL